MNSIDEFLGRKPSKRSLRRIKDKDLYETVEEVFDTETLLALYEIMRRGIVSKVYGVISSGKEARIYWAKDRKGGDLALKIYLTMTAEFRKSIWKYIYGDPRFEGMSPRNIKQLIYLWTRKEFRNLKRLYEAGVRVPKPIFVYKNILVMEFIGKNGIRAPLLKEVYRDLDLDTHKRIFNKVIEYIARAYHLANLVHADLSEYNIMVYDSEPVIIDVSQAVHIAHMNALEFLRRDISNIVRFFKYEVRLNIPSEEEVYKEVMEWKLKEGMKEEEKE